LSVFQSISLKKSDYQNRWVQVLRGPNKALLGDLESFNAVNTSSGVRLQASPTILKVSNEGC
jgi:hypothetical protein